MALQTKGECRYGDAQEDIQAYLSEFSERSYPTEHFADAVCSCGSNKFKLFIDDAAGASIRSCYRCGTEHPMGDSDEYLEEAELEECECPCGNDIFEITVGVALYRESEDVKWLYVGCRCPVCGLTACYGDWKNEYIDYRELLARV